MALVDTLIQEGWLKTPRIIDAFRAIDRADFLPDDVKDLAEINEALPIGYGQTISQPLVVAFMLELLQPEPGDKILDIGSGSGWTTALLAYIVSQQKNPKSQAPNPKQIPNLKSKITKRGVVAIETITELMEFGKQNVAKYNFVEKGIAQFICADGSKGYEKEAPYEGILVSASVQGKIPKAWQEQLKINGRLVASVRDSIWLFVKKSADTFEEKEYPSFVFVPLIEG